MVLPPWELLLKKMLWRQLDYLSGCQILDFGSGYGITANHLAQNNTVTAIEPDATMLGSAVNDAGYAQIVGGIEKLSDFERHSFDAVVCHNVLEYIPDKAAVVRSFSRILKPGGTLSLCKHNRNGRIMQMAVLLNNFQHAHELMDGKGGQSLQFGEIGYYEDGDAEEWEPAFQLEKAYGVRTFWHLQQNQEIQKDPHWQQEMLAIEERASENPDFQRIAFFHHLIYRKQPEL